MSSSDCDSIRQKIQSGAMTPIRTSRRNRNMKPALGIGVLLFLFAAVASATEKMEITGAVAYTDVLRYDYTGAGKRARVQFWMEFNGHPAIGNPGDPGYQPESGFIRYYLQDADTGTK